MCNQDDILRDSKFEKRKRVWVSEWERENRLILWIRWGYKRFTCTCVCYLCTNCIYACVKLSIKYIYLRNTLILTYPWTWTNLHRFNSSTTTTTTTSTLLSSWIPSSDRQLNWNTPSVQLELLNSKYMLNAASSRTTTTTKNHFVSDFSGLRILLPLLL